MLSEDILDAERLSQERRGVLFLLVVVDGGDLNYFLVCLFVLFVIVVYFLVFLFVVCLLWLLLFVNVLGWSFLL